MGDTLRENDLQIKLKERKHEALKQKNQKDFEAMMKSIKEGEYNHLFTMLSK